MSWEQAWDEIYWNMQDALTKQAEVDVLEDSVKWGLYKGLADGYANSLIWLERGCNPDAPRYGRFPKREENSKADSV
jgi:hypothetical protein